MSSAYIYSRAKIPFHEQESQRVFDKELFFRALADRTRLRLLNLLRSGRSVCLFLCRDLKTNQPKISRHLAYLRRAGIVGVRSEGQWMHYRIVEPDGRGCSTSVDRM